MGWVRAAALAVTLFSLAFASSIGFESLDNGTVWKIWNTQYDYYFNASSGIQFTNHHNRYWTHNVFCAGWKGSGNNESLFEDNFESWSTVDDCNYTTNWTSCTNGTGMVRGIAGTYAYDGTSLRLTGGADDNILMKCGDTTGYTQAWVSFYGRRLNLDVGEYCKMDIKSFGGNWTNIFDSGSGSDGGYNQQILDVTSHISNYTCVRMYSNASELDEGCGVDDFNITTFNQDWYYECNDQLPFDWSYSTDNTSYVNITGYRDREIKGRQVRLGLRYHLGLDDINMTVIPYAKNLGSQDIPNDIGFAWHVNNIQIGTHEENDTILVNNTVYWLNESLDVNFTNLDQTFYKMKDTWTHEWLRLDWNPGLTYRLVLNSTQYQNNTPVRLEINAGPLSSGQEKYTKLYWIDAANLWCGSGSSGTCPNQTDPCSGLTCTYTTCDCVANATQTLDDNVTYYFKSLTVNSGVTLTVDYYAQGGGVGGTNGGNGLGIAGGDGGDGGQTNGGPGGSTAGGGGGGGDGLLYGGGDGGDNSGGGGGGGGSRGGSGGDGSGKITFNAVNFINVSGTLRANGGVGGTGGGTNGPGGAGGGGGDIYLSSANINISGTFEATGGRGGNGAAAQAGGGGGGGGGFLRISATSLSLSGTTNVSGGTGAGLIFAGENGQAGVLDWILVNQSPANNTNFTTGNVTFTFNATSRVNATLSCNITLDGSVIYENNSVVSDIINTHIENIGSTGIKYWNVTCVDFYMTTITETQWLNITFGGGGDTTAPTFSDNATNSTAAGESILHSLMWNDDGTLSQAIFSFDNCTGTFENVSEMSLSGSSSWSNFTVVSNYTKGCTIQWCVYANDTANNWNSSCSSPFSYQTANINRTLIVEWDVNSDINSTKCPADSPCEIAKNFTFSANATVTCQTNPPGYNCNMSGGIKYNDTLSTYQYINTTEGAVPFYVVNVSNTSNPEYFGLLSHGQSVKLNYTVNATGTINDTYKLQFNFTSSDSDFWSNTSDSAYVKIVNHTKILLVQWTTGSDVDSGTCPVGSPCEYLQYEQFFANTTVTCQTEPSGLSCGTITAGVIYNVSASGYEYVNTTSGAIPMYIVNTSLTPNPRNVGTLSDGQTAEVNYTINMTNVPAKFYNIILNFSSSETGVSDQSVNPAYLEIKLDSTHNLYCSDSSPGTCPIYTSICVGSDCIYSTCECIVDTSQTLDDDVTYQFKSLTVNSGVTVTVDYYAPGGGNGGGNGSSGLGYVGGLGGDGSGSSSYGSGGHTAGGGGGGKGSSGLAGDGGNYSGGGGDGGDVGGNGGDGGGKIIFTTADFINVSGTLRANGQRGYNGVNDCCSWGGGGGGGGGGGEIYLSSQNVVVSGTFQANAGNGGDPGNVYDVMTGGGGGGGGGFLRISAKSLEVSGTTEVSKGIGGDGQFFDGENGTAGVIDWMLINLTSLNNNTYVPPGDVTFQFNATSRVNGTFYCNISLNGSVIYENSSVIANVTTSHTETIGTEGLRYWNVTCNDTYMQTTSETRYLNIYSDSTPPTYSLNSTNSTTAGDYVEHRLKWNDDSVLAGYVFSFDNCTGTLVNDSWTSFSGATWSNVTKKVNYTSGCTIQWCVYANDTSGNWNSTLCSSPFNYQTSAFVYISISLTSTLQSGVIFGSLSPGTDNSSSSNCAGAGCNISISVDTNVNVDVVTRVDPYLTRWGGSETLQEQYWNASASTYPTGAAHHFSTSYDYSNLMTFNATNGTDVTFESWLTVPTGQAAGLYNNTIYFCATETEISDC